MNDNAHADRTLKRSIVGYFRPGDVIDENSNPALCGLTSSSQYYGLCLTVHDEDHIDGSCDDDAVDVTTPHFHVNVNGDYDDDADGKVLFSNSVDALNECNIDMADDCSYVAFELSDSTCNDLTLFPPANDGPVVRHSSLLAFLDYTSCILGRSTLRNWLKRPLKCTRGIGRRQNAVAWLKDAQQYADGEEPHADLVLQLIRSLKVSGDTLSQQTAIVLRSKQMSPTGCVRLMTSYQPIACAMLAVLRLPTLPDLLRQEMNKVRWTVLEEVMSLFQLALSVEAADRDDMRSLFRRDSEWWKSSAMLTQSGAAIDVEVALGHADSAEDEVRRVEEALDKELTSMISTLRMHNGTVISAALEPSLRFVSVRTGKFSQIEYLIQLPHCVSGHAVVVPDDWIEVTRGRVHSRYHTHRAYDDLPPMFVPPIICTDLRIAVPQWM